MEIQGLTQGLGRRAVLAGLLGGAASGTLALAGCSSSSGDSSSASGATGAAASGATGTAASGSATGSGASDASAPAVTGSSNGKKVTIGITQIVDHPSLNAVRTNLLTALAAKGYVQGQNLTVDYQNPQGDQSALNSIAQKFTSGGYDLLVGIATPTAQALAQATSTIPVVFAAVTDPVAAKLVASLDKPGGNVTGTSDMNPIDKQIGLIKQILPNAKNFGIVYSSSEQNSEVQVTMAKTAAQKLGLEVKTATITNSSEIQQAAQTLDVDAYYVPTDNTVVSGLEALIQVATDKKVPVISSDGDSVRRGCVASYAVDYPKMGLQTGDMIAKVLDGTKPADIPVGFQSDPELTVNTTAAKAIGLTIDQSLVSAAAKTY